MLEVQEKKWKCLSPLKSLLLSQTVKEIKEGKKTLTLRRADERVSVFTGSDFIHLSTFVARNALYETCHPVWTRFERFVWIWKERKTFHAVLLIQCWIWSGRVSNGQKSVDRLFYVLIVWHVRPAPGKYENRRSTVVPLMLCFWLTLLSNTQKINKSFVRHLQFFVPIDSEMERVTI